MAEAKVSIWRPPQGFTKLLGTLPQIGLGHAALELTTSKNVSYYITWSAQGHPLASPFEFMKKNKWEGIGTGRSNFDDDDEMMQQFLSFGSKKPVVPEKIELPVLCLPSREDGFRHGVATEFIEEFWLQRLNQDQHYAFLSKTKNCTGCVAEALRAGGLDSYLESPNNWFIQDAKTLLTWVRKAKAKIDELNALQDDIDSRMLRLIQDPDVMLNLPQGIPSFEEWKEDSDEVVSHRLVAQRKEQVAELDKLLKAYPNATNNLDRFVLLIKMQSLVYSHMTKKPKSDRAAAVKRLGARVTLVLWGVSYDVKNVQYNSTEESDQALREYSQAMRELAW